MSRWNQPICERCWIDQGSALDADGKLVSIRVAVTVRDDEEPIRTCSYCGKPTIWGAFRRDDPAKVPFPPDPE